MAVLLVGTALALALALAVRSVYKSFRSGDHCALCGGCSRAHCKDSSCCCSIDIEEDPKE